MNTQTVKVLPVTEKVVHIVYGCGCVQTFHVEHETPQVRCAQHGDLQCRFTAEHLPVKAESAQRL